MYIFTVTFFFFLCLNKLLVLEESFLDISLGS